MPDPIGRLIAGKYRVLRHLGSGGVADVYEALHEGIGQRFALKVLKREFAVHSEVAERFLVEARAASAVRHPGVVQLIDYGTLEDGEPFLMMELLAGKRHHRARSRGRAVGETDRLRHRPPGAPGAGGDASHAAGHRDGYTLLRQGVVDVLGGDAAQDALAQGG